MLYAAYKKTVYALRRGLGAGAACHYRVPYPFRDVCKRVGGEEPHSRFFADLKTRLWSRAP